LNFTTKLDSGVGDEQNLACEYAWVDVNFVRLRFLTELTRDNSVRRGLILRVPGELKEFIVFINTPPMGDARTIGFWKNWSSCSGGRQAHIL